MRLKRRGLIEGYIKVPERSKNGKQHLHVLFRGKYIPQDQLSTWWQELHKAKIVDIRRAGKGRSPRGLAGDMASYMTKQKLYRYSWSWGWVWHGFVKDYQRLKKLYRWVTSDINIQDFQSFVRLWRLWLKGFWQPDFTLLPVPP